MNKKDFSDYKFRCSSLGYLMTNPRSKSEKLSETTKQYLLEIYIEEVFGRKYEPESKYLEKGNFAEEDSLDLVTRLENKIYIKNKETLENDFIKGTPDIINGDSIIDIKTCWDIWTFAKTDGTNKNYFFQLQGYMALTGKKKARLIYTLVNTPDHLIVSEKTRRMYKEMIEDGSEAMAEMEKEVEFNMIFDDIPESLRAKAFAFVYDEEVINLVYERVKSAREYLNSMSGL